MTTAADAGDNHALNSPVSARSTVLLCALAGGMGWGIRGQYGHETGAMMAGLLVSGVIGMLYCRSCSTAAVLRMMAWCTIAMGFGGSMTYGQTVGLTHDARLVGNVSALVWGLLGLAVKGGVWIGFAGAFLGMGLSGQRWSSRQMLLLMLLLTVLYFLGIALLNSPHDPTGKNGPAIYFSFEEGWGLPEPLKSRSECWGGLLLALTGLVLVAGVARRERLVVRMALAGILGGALGFPAGQSLQAFHAWHRDWFQTGLAAQVDAVVNWWNLMEITFGMVMGGVLGAAVWLHRRDVHPDIPEDIADQSLLADLLFAIAHLTLLGFSEFGSVPWIDQLYGPGIVMGMIPLTATTRSRWWSAFLLGPVILLPIAGKTVRKLVYEEPVFSAQAGWIVLFLLPMALSGLVIWRLQSLRKTVGNSVHPGSDCLRGDRAARIVLLSGSWTFYLLNLAFFEFPWPWETWTRRTPSLLVFSVCLVGLTTAALRSLRTASQQELP